MTMEIGQDITELFRTPGEREHEFEHAGKTWKFTYRTLTWGQHMGAVEECWGSKINDNGEPETVFDIHAYYVKVLLDAVVKCPGNVSLTKTYLEQLDSSVLWKMLDMVPGPVLGAALEEAKKVSETTAPVESNDAPNAI